MIALSKIVKKIQCVVPLITHHDRFILDVLKDNLNFIIETVFLCVMILSSYILIALYVG